MKKNPWISTNAALGCAAAIQAAFEHACHPYDAPVHKEGELSGKFEYVPPPIRRKNGVRPS